MGKRAKVHVASKTPKISTTYKCLSASEKRVLEDQLLTYLSKAIDVGARRTNCARWEVRVKKLEERLAKIRAATEGR